MANLDMPLHHVTKVIHYWAIRDRANDNNVKLGTKSGFDQ